MSLKAFHFFFIVVSILFSAYFAGWCFNNYEETQSRLIFAFSLGSVIAFAGLTVYLGWFLKKSRNIGFLAIALAFSTSFVSENASACATCFGNPNHPMTRAANQGVWFLMMVIAAVLVGFAGLFVFWGIRSKKYEAQLAH